MQIQQHKLITSFFFIIHTSKHIYVEKQSIIRLDNVFQIQFNVVRICIEFNLYICRDELIILYRHDIQQRLGSKKKMFHSVISIWFTRLKKEIVTIIFIIFYNYSFPTTINISLHNQNLDPPHSIKIPHLILVCLFLFSFFYNSFLPSFTNTSPPLLSLTKSTCTSNSLCSFSTITFHRASKISFPSSK